MGDRWKDHILSSWSTIPGGTPGPTGIPSGCGKPGVARNLEAMLAWAPKAVFRSDAADDSSWVLLSRGRESLLGTGASVLVRGS